MPRVEFIPANFDETSGDGTPTLDFCECCVEQFEEGEPVDQSDCKKLGVDHPCVVGSTDVCHPPYEDDDDDLQNRCNWCNNVLTEEDD